MRERSLAGGMFRRTALIQGITLFPAFFALVAGSVSLDIAHAVNTATVTVKPSSSAVVAGGSLGFYAAVSGNASQTETWFVDGVSMGNATVGTLSPGSDPAHVTYKAPATGGSHTITCVATNSTGSTSGSATITVTSTTPVNTATVTLSPSSSTVAGSGTLALAASVSGTASQTETWFVDNVSMGNATVGTLTPGSDAAHMTYTAPAASGSHVVKCVATDASGSSVSGTASISVQASTTTTGTSSGNTATVTLSPAGTSVAASGTVAYYAAVSGNASQTETWFVDGISMGNATVGTLTPGSNAAHVTYTAPATGGSHTIKCVASNSTGSTSGSTTVTVVASAPAPAPAPTPVTVSMTPTSASLATGAAATFTASVSGSTNTAVTWTVDGVAGGNSTVGVVSGSGNTVTYTAPAAAGSHTVKATSSASSTASASATVTIQAPQVVSLSLSPAGSASVSTSGTQVFTATLSGTTNTSVAWSVDGVAGGNSSVGTISGTGANATYTAPATAGSHTVTATSAASASATASTAISVVAPAAGVAVTIGPAYAWAIGTGGSYTFTASVTGTSNTAVTWSVDGIAGGNASVGTISASGVYTAPSTTRTTVHTITATSQANSSVSGSKRFLVTVSNTVVNAKNYGATGNGSTDDTAAINSAISAAGSGICYVPAGTYMINPEYGGGSHGLSVSNGQTLLLDPGATLQCITQTSGPSKFYTVIAMADSNGAVVGGTIIGDRVARNLPTYLDNSGTDFEQGMGVTIANGTGNIALGVTAKNCSCDGFEVTNSGVGAFLISDCVSDNNRRQGLSITWASSGTVQYCTFSNTNGNDPACGIDIEPDAGCSVSNVMIQNCLFTGNKGGGFEGGPSTSNGPTGANNASCTGCTIQNCTFTNNGGSNYGIGGIYWSESNACNILNNTVQNNVEYGVAVNAGATNFKISGNTVTGNHGNGIACGGNTCTSGEDAGTVVSSNTVTSNTSTQIWVYSSATGVTLSGNTTN